MEHVHCKKECKDRINKSEIENSFQYFKRFDIRPMLHLH